MTHKYVGGPIQRASLVDEVRQRLTQLIKAGEFGPSDPIIESKLAREWQISRSPVREALRQLEQAGLVAFQVGHGYHVPALSRDDFLELMHVRLALERAVTLSVGGRQPDYDVTALREIVDEMRAAVTEPQKDWARCAALDASFHETMCRMAGNNRLVALWKGMSDQLTFVIGVTNQSFPGAEDFVSSHERLVDALASGDRQVIEAAIEEHIMTGMESYLAQE